MAWSPCEGEPISASRVSALISDVVDVAAFVHVETLLAQLHRRGTGMVFHQTCIMRLSYSMISYSDHPELLVPCSSVMTRIVESDSTENNAAGGHLDLSSVGCAQSMQDV